jgi:hypothetical protein
VIRSSQERDGEGRLVLLRISIESIKEDVERGMVLAPSDNRKNENRQQKERFHPYNAEITPPPCRFVEDVTCLQFTAR